jgi:hypothetical protein
MSVLSTMVNVGTKGHVDHGCFDDSYIAIIKRFDALLNAHASELTLKFRDCK